MLKVVTNSSNRLFATGLVLGLLVSLGATLGALGVWGYFAEDRVRAMEEQLHALATHGGDSLAIATGANSPTM